MAANAKKAEELRAAWERALEKGKHADAAKALGDLEGLEPTEPLWSHRLGEALRRVGRSGEAEDAFARAAEKYLERGFLPRAVAMAKLVASLNPARGDLLARITPGARPAPHVAPRVVASAPVAVRAPVPEAPILVRTGASPAAEAPLPLSLSSFPPPGARIASAPPAPVRAAPLARAVDARADEVRFEDAPPSSIHFQIEDVSEISGAILLDDEDEAGVDSTPTARVDMRAPIVLPEPSIDRLGFMAASRLFAGLSREALLAMAEAAELAEFVAEAFVVAKDEPAYAMYAIVEGRARVVVKGATIAALGEGDVFGEACLLDEGRRQADVRAETELMTLRIEKRALDDVAARFPEVEDVLFDLLARRLVMNLMHTSPLFTVFEPKLRLELAQLFEVRRAEAGTVLAEEGRRSDGLYVVLAGTVLSRQGDGPETRIARGTTFGQTSLLGGGASLVSIRTAGESVLLRMPAAKFGALAALYPPALAYLSEIAVEHPPESKRILD